MAASNARIAAVFEEIADLLEVQGENPFRIRAYRNAARTVNQQGPAFAERAARGEELGKLAGVGADLDAKIHEIARTGNCELLQQLRRAVPRGTASLLRIPGLGPKRVRALSERLDIHTPVQLREAAQSGRMQALRGFGPKTTAHVLRALATDRSKKERVPLAIAQRDATGGARSHAKRAGHRRRRRGRQHPPAAPDRRRHRPARGRDRWRRDRAPLRRLPALPRDPRRGRDQGERRARQRNAGRPARGPGRRASAPRCSISPVRRRSTSSCASARSTRG